MLWQSARAVATRTEGMRRVLSPFAAFSSRRPMATSAEFEVNDDMALHRLDEGPATTAVATREEALAFYREMTLVRRMETAAADLYKSKFIRGFCHLYSGQEAVASGIEAALVDGDSIITAYRCHGFTLLRGATVKQVLAELTGRKAGVADGKGGSMHMYAKDFYGGNGIVGAQIPLGAGIAWAHKFKGDGNVAIALYGDGAANQGQAFEAYNMSKLWDLPVVYVCENNKYGMGTAANRAAASAEYYARGDYLPGIRANGMDVLGVREVMKFATQHAREKGPIVVEMVTYRYGGHSMSDPGTSYRTRDEIKRVRTESDPITSLKERCLRAELATAEDFKDIDKEVRAEVDEAVRFAKETPEPDVMEAFQHIYSGAPPPSIRGCDLHTQFQV